jgi:alpha-tubulin suppressor-like RCC1 family protein
MSSLYVMGNTEWEQTASAVRHGLDFPCRVPDCPTGAAYDSIACGERHCMLIAGGKIYGFGVNKDLQIHSQLPDYCHTVSLVPPPAGAAAPVQVACGTKHSLLRCSDGSVYSHGSNAFGQLGHLPGTKAGTPWSRVTLAGAADDVVVHGNCNFAVVAGVLFSWGEQTYGALGHGQTGIKERTKSGGLLDCDHVAHPAKVLWFVNHRLKVLGVSAGPKHMAVRTERDVYTVGAGSFGRLGTGGISAELIPQRVPFDATVGNVEETLERVTCGYEHTVVLKRSSMGPIVYYWGKANTGGDSDLRPCRLSWGIPEDIDSIRGCRDFNVATTKSGAVLVWGIGYNQQFGSSTMGHTQGGTSKRFPKVMSCMEGKHVTQALAGGSFIVFVADDSKFVAGATPETISLDVQVAKSLRYANFTPRLTPERYEDAVKAYYQRVLGNAAGAARAAKIPTATQVVVIKQTVVKRHARNLHRGSKVRVWLTDVYAMGQVTARDLPGCSANQFEVKWAREDWDPELVELHSDDETLDEENENRWQNLWFPSETTVHTE